MTVSTPDFAAMPKAPRAARPGRLEWSRALKAFRRLRADKEDTVQVFEIMRALSGRSAYSGYERLLATSQGGRIAYDRVEFAERLMDRAWVESFAPGTVGAAYADFTARENLSAEGLAEESRKGLGAGDIDARHPVAWFGRRIRDTHDLWHILSGYGRDALGEACLVAFSYAQTGGLPVRRAIWEGYRRGNAAAWLPGQDYEALMAEPLEAARKRLNLPAPATYNAFPQEFRNEAAMVSIAA